MQNVNRERMLREIAGAGLLYIFPDRFRYSAGSTCAQLSVPPIFGGITG